METLTKGMQKLMLRHVIENYASFSVNYYGIYVENQIH